MDHSIENLADNIYNSKTKQYFQEVIQTYYSNCYRSSIVMLYSVVICDLIFKLEDLRDVYNDQTAKKILLEIEGLQKDNPRSPDWEGKLIEMVRERTKMLEMSDLENINQLHKHRHLSAHPVLNQTSILYQPNKETVKAHIKNVLEGVLTQPPIFSARIFNDLVLDLSNNRDRFPNDDELKRFLNAKYFRGLRVETFKEIFKKLWKFVFKLDNDDANLNREINFKTIEIIFRQHTEPVLQLLRAEETHFNDVTQGETMEYLFTLLFRNPKIYNVLSDLNKQAIEMEISASTGYKLMSWFTYASFDEYKIAVPTLFANDARFYVDHRLYNNIMNLFKEFDSKKEFIDLLIVLYFKSNTYNTADQNFSRIEPFLSDFSSEQLIKLLETINSNAQISGRSLARYSNKIIKEACEMKLPADFNYNQYYHFDI
ncbi:MAG: hypothetical protein ACLGH8_03325 [Bacteroidia bacterium]